MPKTQKGIVMPDELIKEIEVFQKENYMTSFTQAIIELVRRGLRHTRSSK